MLRTAPGTEEGPESRKFLLIQGRERMPGVTFSSSQRRV